MFGYIKINKPELLVKDYDIYKGIYCALCKHLGKNYGMLMRYFLSFDATFIAILHMSLKDEKQYCQEMHCSVNPFKKCNCVGDDESLLFASGVMTIMVHYKLNDDIRDGNFFKKILSYFLKALSSRGFKKAKSDYPKVDLIFREYIDKQNAVEKNNTSDIDTSAEPTATMMSEVFTMLSNDANQQKILGRLGLFLGRWIYLLDAVDDLEKDKKNENFNPFKNAPTETSADEKKHKTSVLNLTLSQVIATYDILELSKFQPIVDNIIYKGLPMVQKNVLLCKNCKKNRKNFKREVS